MTSKKEDGLFEIQFASEPLKLVSASKQGNADWNAENSLFVTFSFIVAFEHEIINILLPVLSIFSFFFYEHNLINQGFVYMDFIKYQMGLRRSMHVFAKKVREKSRMCHYHKPQPFPDPKRKRKPTNPNRHKSNERTKSTKISSLFPKRGNRNAKRIEKEKNKMTQGKT